jgi:hypothetical protein
MPNKTRKKTYLQLFERETYGSIPTNLEKSRNLWFLESIPLLGMKNFPLHAPFASRTNRPGSSTLPGSSVPPRPKTFGDAVGMRFSWGMTPPVLMGATQQVISSGVQSIKIGLQQIGSSSLRFVEIKIRRIKEGGEHMVFLYNPTLLCSLFIRFASVRSTVPELQDIQNIR